MTETDKKICEQFNRAFQTVSTVEDTPPPELGKGTEMDTILGNMTISVMEVHRLLKELNPHKAKGPDDIATFILKKCAEELAVSLTNLFNLSLMTGELLIDWKIADIIPIFKRKGSRDRALNYRSVSLTSALCKIMEKILRRKLSNT